MVVSMILLKKKNKKKNNNKKRYMYVYSSQGILKILRIFLS